jgi:hypothetical protein
MSNVHQRRIGGNLVWYDAHKKRLVEAIGPDVIKVFEDFAGPVVASSDALVGWTTTLVEGGNGESTLTVPDASAGNLLLTTDDAENDGINLQKIGENFGFGAGQSATYFGIRLKISDATQSDFIAGLCITNTALLGGMTDGVFFRKVDGSTALAAVTEKDSTETESAAVHTIVADTWVTLEFFFDGATVEFFVNGRSVATHLDDEEEEIVSNIPDNELLTPSIHFLTGATAAKTMTVDWVRVIQIGR